MRSLICTICLLTILPSLARAEGEPGPRGYVFFAPGRVEKETTLHVGAGMDGAIYKGLGAGAELGFLGPRQELREGFGIFSVNGLYDFPQLRPSAKLHPFATAGYSLGFRSGTINGYNFGFGANYWISERMGLRFEYRDNVFHHEDFHGFRIAWTAR
jgi:opacity protein-like surface antigen